MRFKLQKYLTQKDAEKKFKQIEDAVRSLAQHPNFPTFIEYWEREYEAVDREIESLIGKHEELDRALIKRKEIDKFLKFIENLTQ